MQTWPYLDTLVTLYRNLLQTGLDCFLFLMGGDGWLVNHLFSPTLLKGLLSLKFTITQSLRKGQMIFRGI